MVQKQTGCDWADLPIVLAVARHGTLRTAARALGVSHSTVLRRLESVEASLGAKLFERRPTGRLELTPAGQDAFETSLHLEELVGVMERRIHGRDLDLAGPLQVTMPAALLPVLARELAAFCDRYPKIALSVAAGFGYVDLAHREADVALRVTDHPSPELVGRRLVSVGVGIYGSVAYLASRPARTSLDRHEFIGWDPSVSHAAFARWMQQHVPRARIRCCITQDWQIKEAIDADLGLALAPCALGDLQPHWRRVKLLRDMAAPLWLLTHRDLRSTARMRAFREWLAETVLAKRDLIEGRRPREGG
jgi:DNA-binding transcriptional LysR family regulator